MAEMTMEQAIHWAEQLSNPGKYGMTPLMRTIAGIINRHTKANFKQHRSPAGRAWPPTERLLDESVLYPGGPGRIGRKIFHIKNMASARALAKYYNTGHHAGGKRYSAAGGPKFTKAGKALYRRGVRRMLDKMTKKSARGHIQAVGRDFVKVGGRGRSMVKHQEGGVIKGGKHKAARIPPRRFMGVSPALVRDVEAAAKKWFVKQVTKKGLGAIRV